LEISNHNKELVLLIRQRDQQIASQHGQIEYMHQQIEELQKQVHSLMQGKSGRV